MKQPCTRKAIHCQGLAQTAGKRKCPWCSAVKQNAVYIVILVKYCGNACSCGQGHTVYVFAVYTWLERFVSCATVPGTTLLPVGVCFADYFVTTSSVDHLILFWLQTLFRSVCYFVCYNCFQLSFSKSLAIKWDLLAGQFAKKSFSYLLDKLCCSTLVNFHCWNLKLGIATVSAKEGLNSKWHMLSLATTRHYWKSNTWSWPRQLHSQYFHWCAAQNLSTTTNVTNFNGGICSLFTVPGISRLVMWATQDHGFDSQSGLTYILKG